MKEMQIIITVVFAIVLATFFVITVVKQIRKSKTIDPYYHSELPYYKLFDCDVPNESEEAYNARVEDFWKMQEAQKNDNCENGHDDNRGFYF